MEITRCRTNSLAFETLSCHCLEDIIRYQREQLSALATLIEDKDAKRIVVKACLTLDNVDKGNWRLGLIQLGSLLGTILLGHSRLCQDEHVGHVLVRAVVSSVDDLFHDEGDLREIVIESRERCVKVIENGGESRREEHLLVLP